MADGTTLEVYKCPSCGGAVRFDATSGSLVCRWCERAYEPEGLEPKQVNSTLESYLCPECGAELMADDFIVADTCPFCGNHEIAPHRFQGDFEPDFVIPFAITKKQAMELYENTLAEKLYLPDDYAEKSSIASIQGTYVPFWLHSGVLDFDFSYITTQSSGKGISSNNHRRAGTYEFARLPADGSERMPDDVMDSIEPYDFHALVPFSADYLPGFIAERYTVSSDEVEERVDLRVMASALIEARNTITERYNTVRADRDRLTCSVNRSSVEQVLLPVWLIVVSYNGQKILVGINGQTGKVAANLPIDEKKQRQAALRMTPKIMVPLAPILLIIPLVIIGYGIYDTGFDVLMASLAGIVSGAPPADDATFRTTIIFLAGVVAAILVLALVGRSSYKEAKEQIRKSMQNVETSIDANEFATMTITKSVR